MDIPYGISPVAHPQIVTPTNIFHTVVKNILKIGKKKLAKWEKNCLVNLTMHIHVTYLRLYR